MQKHLGIIDTLKLLAFLPLVVILVFFVIFGIDSYHKLDSFHTLKKNIIAIKAIANLSNEMQCERGISSGYQGSKGKLFKSELLLHRARVDKACNLPELESISDFSYFTEVKKRVYTLRHKIDASTIEKVDTFDAYTQIIRDLFKTYKVQTILLNDHKAKNLLISYTGLALMKESLGQIRGSLNGILSLGKIDSRFLFRIIHAVGTYDLSLHDLRSNADTWIKKDLNAIITSSTYNWVEAIINSVAKHGIIDEKLKPSVWWNKSTSEIERLYVLENKFFQKLDYYISQKSKYLIITLSFDALAFLLLAGFISLLGFKIRDNILNNIRLLKEYKDAVDRSNIVSKTDKRGVITYANSKFCSISGYSQDELVGKSHNIVRHPDMPKKSFANMWETIQNKKPWYGIVKNRKKNGGSYTVEATISPIINNEGEIEEFIAIRNDITELVELHHDIESTQSDLILRLSEIIDTRNQETGQHVRRVSEYSRLLAGYYGLDETALRYLVAASPMHDIGKIGIPDHILSKPGKLTEEEMRIMRTHTELGYKLFKDSDKPLLQAAATIAYEHHEKYDGTGYPRGLKAEEIHIYGRITALADVFDSLGSQRCYKDIWEDERIFTLLKEERGKHFDPDLVDIFFAHLEEFLAIRKVYGEN